MDLDFNNINKEFEQKVAKKYNLIKGLSEEQKWQKLDPEIKEYIVYKMKQCKTEKEKEQVKQKLLKKFAGGGQKHISPEKLKVKNNIEVEKTAKKYINSFKNVNELKAGYIRVFKVYKDLSNKNSMLREKVKKAESYNKKNIETLENMHQTFLIVNQEVEQLKQQKQETEAEIEKLKSRNEQLKTEKKDYYDLYKKYYNLSKDKNKDIYKPHI
jgi:chromosome segregation ATPase